MSVQVEQNALRGQVHVDLGHDGGVGWCDSGPDERELVNLMAVRATTKRCLCEEAFR